MNPSRAVHLQSLTENKFPSDRAPARSTPNRQLYCWVGVGTAKRRAATTLEFEFGVRSRLATRSSHHGQFVLSFPLRY
jgi:hypothetical protein